jgi:hypothetical protein
MGLAANGTTATGVRAVTDRDDAGGRIGRATIARVAMINRVAMIGRRATTVGHATFARVAMIGGRVAMIGGRVAMIAGRAAFARQATNVPTGVAMARASRTTGRVETMRVATKVVATRIAPSREDSTVSGTGHLVPARGLRVLGAITPGRAVPGSVDRAERIGRSARTIGSQAAVRSSAGRTVAARLARRRPTRLASSPKTTS